MLILSRKLTEKVIIGDEVIISVLGVNGNQIRLGIEAPREVPVHREEVYDRIRESEGKPKKIRSNTKVTS